MERIFTLGEKGCGFIVKDDFGILNDRRLDLSYYRVAFKPPATISQEQPTAKYDGSEGVLAAKGRHDPCVLPRAVPIVEAMASIVVME